MLNLDKTVLNLVDSHENKYSLTKASDITSHYTDDQLLKELLIMVLLALFASYVLQLLGLPSFFGQLIVGAMIGSSGLIDSIIPLDTISRGFGTIFIMFSL